MNDFAHRLRIVIEKSGKQQKALASDLKLSPARFSNYINGHSEPSLTILAQICKGLGVSADYLLGLSDAQTTIEKPKKSELGSLLDATIQRDPFADLTPEQRTVIESSLAAFRAANDAAASRQDA